MTDRLKDKIVLVTGAAQGIGAGIASTMVAHGATVIYTDLRGDAVRNAANGNRGTLAFPLDVTSEESWKAVAEEIKERFGRLDVLVNNAGMDMSKPLEETSFSDWRRLMAVNVDGIFLGCREMQPLLKNGGQHHRGGASVINLSSVVGIVGYQDQVAYNTSKAAVAQIARSLAIEWAHHKYNIRANSIHPGAIETEMVKEHVAAQVARGHDEAEVWNAIAAMAPLNRLGKVADVAAAAVFLGSEEASFVNATQLVVDGGFVGR